MRLGQSIQQDLKAVGIQADIKAVAFPVWLTEIARERHVPMSMNDWYQDFPDPSDFLDVLLNSKQAIPRDGNNSAFYKSKAMDALLNKASSDTNPQDRLALYRQANRLAVHDAPWVFLYYPVSYNLRRPWVHGYVPHPVWVTRYERIWLSRKGSAS
jgi:ABC-type transport system substrate-binding protein